jgi:hypothetical protein
MERFNLYCQKNSIINLGTIKLNTRATFLIISLQEVKGAKPTTEGAESLIQFDCTDPGTQRRCHCLYFFDPNTIKSVPQVKKGSILLGNFYVR